VKFKNGICVYITLVSGCNNNQCQIYKHCSSYFFKNSKHSGIKQIDITTLNRILDDCLKNMDKISRIFINQRGDSQIYEHAKDINVGDYPSRFIISYTYPYPIDRFPSNISKIYRVDTLKETQALISLPDFWSREMSKIYTIASKKNISEIIDIIKLIKYIRERRTVIYVITSLERIPSFRIEKNILEESLKGSQFVEMEEAPYSLCNNGLNFDINYMGKVGLHHNVDFGKDLIDYTIFQEVYDALMQQKRYAKEKEYCLRCLKEEEQKWMYVLI